MNADSSLITDIYDKTFDGDVFVFRRRNNNQLIKFDQPHLYRPYMADGDIMKVQELRDNQRKIKLSQLLEENDFDGMPD